MGFARWMSKRTDQPMRTRDGRGETTTNIVELLIHLLRTRNSEWNAIIPAQTTQSPQVVFMNANHEECIHKRIAVLAMYRP